MGAGLQAIMRVACPPMGPSWSIAGPDQPTLTESSCAINSTDRNISSVSVRV